MNYSAAVRPNAQRHVSPATGWGALGFLIACSLTAQFTQAATQSPYEVFDGPLPVALTASRVSTGSQPQSATPEYSPGLAHWVDYALANNPRLRAARFQHEAALERVPQVTALPDPKLSFRYFIDPVETRVGPQKYALGVSQPLPWLGKRRLDRELAQQQAQGVAAQISTLQNALIAEVAGAWSELYYFSSSVSILQKSRELLSYLEQVAQARYRSGASSHPDVIRAQLELGKIENELASLIDRRGTLLTRFNAALGRPGSAALRFPESLPIIRLELSDAEILHAVVENNPELAVLAADIAAAGVARERAGASFYPDFSLGVDFIATGSATNPELPDSGQDALAAGITMTLPLQRNGYRAGLRAAEARIAVEQARRDQLLNRLQVESSDALFRLRDAQRQMDLYADTLLPKANESVLATQRAYSAGSVDFVELVDAQQTLLIFELAAARAISDHNLARISLEKLMGASLRSSAGVAMTGGQADGAK